MAAAVPPPPAVMGPRPVTASLYVGDLPTNLDNAENVLYEVFSKIGMVVSIKVCRDINTQRSLGYAYVNFQAPQDAERALDSLNFYQIRPGKQIRIMWSHRDPVMRKTGAGNIFIKNLDESIDNKALMDTFSVFGNILSSKVATDDNGVSRGYGFVHFETEESAKEAIARVNGMLIKNKPVNVMPFIKKLERLQAEGHTFTNVYLKNLAETVTEEDIKKAVNAPTQSIFVSAHPEHKTKFALVNFDKHEDAVEFINNHHEKVWPGIGDGEAKVQAFRALKRRDRQAQLKLQASQSPQNLLQSQGRNLYVKHLEDTITEEAFREMFAPFGEITSAALCKDPQTGAMRGFGFVCFASAESAKNAIRDMNGKMLYKRPLYVGLAQQKDQRHRMLEEQRKMMNQRMMMNPGAMGPFTPFGMFPPAPFGAMGGGPLGRMPPFQQPMGPGPMGRGGFGPLGGRGMGVRQPMAPPMGGRPPQFPMGQKFVPGPPAGPGRYTQSPQQPRPHQPTSVVGISANDLTKMSPEEQKNALGERLYVKITELRPQQAAKITGMLLEMDTPEILHVLEDANMLRSKIEEAVSVLKQHTEGGTS